MEKGKAAYQHVTLLMHLRNTLVHYVPEWLPPISSEDPDVTIEHKLEKQLKGKFEVNPMFRSSGNPFFPDKCLGYGCAQWAILCSIDFVKEWYARLGYQCSLESFRKRASEH